MVVASSDDLTQDIHQKSVALRRSYHVRKGTPDSRLMANPPQTDFYAHNANLGALAFFGPQGLEVRPEDRLGPSWSLKLEA